MGWGSSGIEGCESSHLSLSQALRACCWQGPVFNTQHAPARRATRNQGEEANNGATAKVSMDALAAASAKQPAVPTTMSKSMAMPFLPPSGPAPMAPWHKTSPLPAPPSAPWRSATLPAPPQKASAPSTPWPLQSSSLHSDGLPSFVDRVAGVLGPSAGSDVLPLDEYKSRLATIYSVHNPSNVSKIGYLLSKYKDQEQLLYQSVCSKYQIPSTWDGRQPLPSLPSAIPDPASVSRFRV